MVTKLLEVSIGCIVTLLASYFWVKDPLFSVAFASATLVYYGAYKENKPLSFIGVSIIAVLSIRNIFIGIVEHRIDSYLGGLFILLLYTAGVTLLFQEIVDYVKSIMYRIRNWKIYKQ